MLLVLVSVAGAATAVLAGPVTVRQWVTPKPGQPAFDPPPGAFAPEVTYDDWQPNQPIPIASFLPHERWALPDTPYTPGESKAGSRRYEFTYHAEVTDGGRAATFEMDGVVTADWMQRYDGLVLPGAVMVWIDQPLMIALVSDDPFVVTTRQVRESEDRIGAEVELTVRPTDTPEPGTLLLAVGGLGAAGGWVWRKKQRRAVLTPDHLPQ
jgi:hypothetical protein